MYYDKTKDARKTKNSYSGTIKAAYRSYCIWLSDPTNHFHTFPRQLIAETSGSSMRRFTASLLNRLFLGISPLVGGWAVGTSLS